MTECPICGAANFDENDGLYFCADCGTQSQDIRDEVVDDTADQTLSQSKLMRVKTQKKEVAVEAKVSWNHYELFQIVLQAQADAIVKLGFKPVVKDCIRTLWFHFLKHYGVKKLEEGLPLQSSDEPSAKKRKIEDTSGQENAADALSTLAFDPDRELNLDITSTSDSSISDEEVEDDSLVSGTQNESSTGKRERLNSPHLSLMNCIALCYLGLLYAEETVLLVDMARWARTNRIPYYQLCTSVLPENFQLSAVDRVTFSPVHIIRPDRIHLHARKLYQNLALPALPTAAVTAIGNELLKRLELPVSFQRCLKKLLFLNPLDPNSGLVAPNYMSFERTEVECMAAIAVLLKMLYRLDDHYEVCQSQFVEAEHCTATQEEGMIVWSDWVEMFTEQRNQEEIAGLVLTPEELLRAKDLNEYLTFCKTQIFGCNRKESKFSTFHKDSTKELELIFTDFLTKTSQPNSSSQASRPDSVNPSSSEPSTSNKPRIIPLDFSLPGLGQACRAYYVQPAKFNFHELPSSYQFVLSVCSSLVETDTKILYNCVKHLETQLNRQLTFVKNIEKEYSEDTGMINVQLIITFYWWLYSV